MQMMDSVLSTSKSWTIVKILGCYTALKSEQIFFIREIVWKHHQEDQDNDEITI
jgi:hypothetical protein